MNSNEIYSPERDSKVESRLGLKKQLEEKHRLNQMDFSSLTQSKGQIQSSMFPHISEPTLEDYQPGQSGKQYDDSSLQYYYAAGMTARNTSQKSKLGNSNFMLLEMKVQKLEGELQLKQAEVHKYQNTSRKLEAEVGRLEKELQSKKKFIERQRDQINDLRYRQSQLSQYDTRQSSSSCKSVMSDSISDFCPQMLSPDETVQLLNQLLKKVCKSSKMMKTMTADPVIRQMLGKMRSS